MKPTMKQEGPLLRMSVQAAADRTAEINIEGEIGWYEWDGEKYIANTASAIRRQLEELMAMDVDHIIVNIHSLGGFVDDGLAIHDALAAHKAKITTRVTGFTASAATVIAQAGDVREISANAFYLVHEAWGFAIGTATQMMETVEFLDTINTKMADLYARRAKGKQDTFRQLMAENQGVGRWLTAEKAKEHGLVDEIYEPMQAAAAATEFARASTFGLDLPDDVAKAYADAKPEPAPQPTAAPAAATPAEPQPVKVADQYQARARALTAEMSMQTNLITPL